LKDFVINLFRYQQLAGYRCRSLAAIRYVAIAILTLYKKY